MHLSLQTHWPIIFPVCFYECKTWCLMLYLPKFITTTVGAKSACVLAGSRVYVRVKVAVNELVGRFCSGCKAGFELLHEATAGGTMPGHIWPPPPPPPPRFFQHSIAPFLHRIAGSLRSPCIYFTQTQRVFKILILILAHFVFRWHSAIFRWSIYRCILDYSKCSSHTNTV
jgi:hypothetical protein